MSSRCPERAGALLLATLLTWAIVAQADETATRELRVCADPNNLPFSNVREEGFENRLADLIARELGASVRYTWWAQRRGFLRSTLRAGACDVVLGVPRDWDAVATTRPYFRSSYVFVTPRERALHLTGFDDPALRTLRIGVHLIGDDYANTPPAHALARRGLVANLVGFTIYGDYREPSPPARIVDAVARGEIDVAIVWGPLAGYFAPRQARALDVTPVGVAIDEPGLPLAFDIAVGVRKGDTALRDELDRVLDRQRAAIERLLDAYGVPRVPAPASATR